MPKILTGLRAQSAAHWLDEAARTGLQSPCFRRRCGSVLVYNNVVIAKAFNSPPRNAKPHCVPYAPHLASGFKSDKTCCTHAEQKVIYNALRDGFAKRFSGATLYFASVNGSGERELSGQPYCTICSKAAAEHDIGWVLEHESGITYYNAAEYNQISFEYGRE